MSQPESLQNSQCHQGFFPKPWASSIHPERCATCPAVAFPWAFTENHCTHGARPASSGRPGPREWSAPSGPRCRRCLRFGGLASKTRGPQIERMGTVSRQMLKGRLLPGGLCIGFRAPSFPIIYARGSQYNPVYEAPQKEVRTPI